jgi:membrane fusion protein (multidrug efflux system)
VFGHEIAMPQVIDEPLVLEQAIPVHAGPPMPQDAAPAPRPPAAPKPRARRILLSVVAAAGLIGAVVAVLYAIHAQHYESTDDAVLEGHVIPIGPQVAARVLAVNVVDNQFVHKDDVIVELDPTDYKVAVEQAQGNLAAMDGKVSEARAEVLAADAQRDQSRAAVDAAQTNFEILAGDFKRDQSLDERAISKQQFDTDDAAQKSAAAQVKEAKAKLASSASLITIADAAVLAAQGDDAKARADLQRDQTNLGYCRILAPESGRITRKNVETGEYVAVGQALLAVVPPEVWVVADFKETQLTYMRLNQPVSVHVDAYPDREFSGRVESFQAGTGSRFSMLPAENATGNFVKIVQRIPVKILLDPDQTNTSDVVLVPGMSVEAEVTVR